MEWQCIKHNPTTWALGRREGDRLVGIVAWVTRSESGHWGWYVATNRGPACGIEPSRELAIDSASQVAGVVTPEVTP